MGKNLKRQNDVLLGTPGKGGSRGTSNKLQVSVGGKRHKQMSLVPFLRTPAHAEETPALQAKAGKAGNASTGLHNKLGQLHLRTHQKQQPNTSTAAPTQGRPAVPEPQWQKATPGSDDDFVISMSQTYERTQPEPCCDYGSAEHEEVELSLRRTQQYHAAGSTQRYGQHHHHHHHQHHQQLHQQLHQHHHHDFLVATVVAALDTAADAGVATSTADAWETSLAHVSALGVPAAVGVASATTILPPPPLVLEEQGSNQPEHVAALLAAANGVSRELSRVGPRPALDLTLPLLQPALQATSTGPAQTPELQGGGGGGAGGGAGGSGGGGDVCAHATVAEDVADDGTTPPLQVGMPLFPIFTQGKARRRPIHLIRHGESEYNLACKRRGGFGDPSDIFDARLTATGEKQAKALRQQVLDLTHQHGDPLFIVSPLSRAIETFLLMLPDPERLRVCPQTPPPASSSQQLLQPSQPHAPQQQRDGEGQALASKPVNVLICSFLTEFLHTSGDVGRPRSVLIESYPQLAEQLRKGLDKERWWYENTSKGPNCALNKTLSSTEPDKSAKARVDRFRQFVFSQPHRPVVVVGHANFFKTLTHDSHYMSNCQMMSWAP